VIDRLEAHGMSKLAFGMVVCHCLARQLEDRDGGLMEGYHVMRTHPQLQKASPALYNMMYGQDTGGIGQLVIRT